MNSENESENVSDFSPLDESYVSKGSLLMPQHKHRQVEVYPVFKSELHTLSIFNWITGLFGAAGTGFVTFAFGLMVDVAKEPEAVTRPNVVPVVCIGCIVMAIVCYVVAGIAFWRRWSESQTITTRGIIHITKPD